MSEKREPFVCTTGCHSGSFADFDHYFEVEGWSDGEEGEAFGHWLAGRFRIDVVGQRLGTSGFKGHEDE